MNDKNLAERVRSELERAQAEDDATRLEVLEKIHQDLEEEVEQAAATGR